MRKFFCAAATVILLAAISSFLSWKIDTAFNVVFFCVTEFLLYAGSKQISKDSTLYRPEIYLIYSCMWFLIMLLGQPVSDIVSRFTGSGFCYETAFYIFSLPVVLALVVFYLGVLYQGIKKVEDMFLR